MRRSLNCLNIVQLSGRWAEGQGKGRSLDWQPNVRRISAVNVKRVHYSIPTDNGANFVDDFGEALNCDGEEDTCANTRQNICIRNWILLTLQSVMSSHVQWFYQRIKRNIMILHRNIKEVLIINLIPFIPLSIDRYRDTHPDNQSNLSATVWSSINHSSLSLLSLCWWQ